MATRTQDTQPDGPRVPTDPGLAPESAPGGVSSSVSPSVALKKATDPGIAPPSSGTARLELVDRGSAERGGRLLDASPDLPPAVLRLGGDPTPVPPEDGLLNGLIASESEAYFHRAKAASASSGEAAAAFHGEPHALLQGSPTPAPEPPVLLRRSVEMDIAEAAAVAAARRNAPVEELTDPMPRDLRRATPPDLTVPLPAPKSPVIEKVLAFVVAVMVVGILGVLLVRWLSSGDTAPPAASVSTGSTGVVATSPPPSPPPMAATIPPPEPVAPNATVHTQPPPPVDSPPPRPVGKAPVTNPSQASPTPRTSPRPAPTPGEVLPPEKNDVKRSM